MNQQTMDPMAQILDASAFDNAGQQLQNLPMTAPQMPVMGQTEFIVAQRVPQPRKYGLIMERMRALAAAAGDKYVYGWDVKDRRNNRTVRIEGPTIKLANDLWREFGNCVVDVRVLDEGAHWMFYARFIDLETGANMTRAYQQRKAQNLGMADEQRAMDMILQIGQSKAIRNVVTNALQTLSEFTVEEAKRAIVGRIAKSPEEARTYIVQQLEKLQIDRRRVERIYGRQSANWTVPDMAKIYTELRGVIDGMVNPEDVWPDDEVNKPQQEQETKPRRGTARQNQAAPASKPQAPPEAPPQGPQEHVQTEKAEEPRTPEKTVHLYLASGKALGSIQARGIDTGVIVNLENENAQYRIVEYTDRGHDYVAIVTPVPSSTAQEPRPQANGDSGASSGDQPQTGAPRGTRSIDSYIEQGSPDAPPAPNVADEPKPQPAKRGRRGGGSLFSPD